MLPVLQIATESYITLTCHFIDLQWDIKSICLQTRYHPESHTEVNLKEMLRDAFCEWKIDQKYITGVIDNSRNMVNAWKLLQKPHVMLWSHHESTCEERHGSGEPGKYSQ